MVMGWVVPAAVGITIEVDYSYDTNHFFSEAGNPQAAEARATVEAAAARWGRIIDQSLLEVTLADDNDDPRIGFDHPGTGAYYQISAANSANTDSLVTEGGGTIANEYRGTWTIPADVWILYVGGRPTGNGSLSTGGTATGLNWFEILNADSGPHNRGFTNQGQVLGATSLPVWGGAISFESSTANWHFDHTAEQQAGTLDLYSFALHEIGHALGLNTGEISAPLWYEWSRHINAQGFVGSHALAAYNLDNSSNRTFLKLEDAHWADGTYDSVIFPAGSPNYTGTAGACALQDLLMEPRLAPMRVEVTNVDVGALRDLGWSVIRGEVISPVLVEGLKIAPAAGGSPRLTWLCQAGASYTVQTSMGLNAWSDVTPAVRTKGSHTSWTDGDPAFYDPNPPAAQSAKKFYRVVAK